MKKIIEPIRIETSITRLQGYTATGKLSQHLLAAAYKLYLSAWAHYIISYARDHRQFKTQWQIRDHRHYHWRRVRLDVRSAF